MTTLISTSSKKEFKKTLQITTSIHVSKQNNSEAEPTK